MLSMESEAGLLTPVMLRGDSGAIIDNGQSIRRRIQLYCRPLNFES